MSDKWWVFNQFVKLADTRAQAEIDAQNAETLPFVMVEVSGSGPGGSYVHFFVSVEEKTLLVFGGETRMTEALEAAKAIYWAYQQGQEHVKQQVRSALDL